MERDDGGTLNICGWFVVLTSRLRIPINYRRAGGKGESNKKYNDSGSDR